MEPIMNYTVTDAERSRVAGVRNLAQKGKPGTAELVSMLADPSWVVRRAVVESLSLAPDTALEMLLDVLRFSRDNEARIAAAVDALSAYHGDAEDALLKLTEHKDPAVVADALQILGRRRSEKAVPTLIRFTAHESDVVSVSAIEALGRIGGRAAVDALIDTVGTGNFFRTFPAIDILGRSGDRRVVEPLAKLLANPNYLPEAARALGRSGEKAAVKPLLDLFRSQSDSVIRVAAVSLWELRERYADRAGGDGTAIDEILRAGIGSEVVRRLTRVINGLDVPETVAVCRLFGAVGNAEATSLLTMQLDGPPAVAESAAEALRKIGKESDLHLLRALRAGDSGRRKALLPVVSSTFAATEVSMCLTDADPEVRALACETIARLGNTSVVPELFALLADDNLRVVHSATAAIQALGSRQARELAMTSAKSANPVVRRASLRILSYFGDAGSLQPILEGLEDPDPRVREVAIQGLPYVEEPRAATALYQITRSKDPRTRALAMRALGQLPRAEARVFSILLRGLSDDDAWVRYYSCQSIGRLGYSDGAVEVATLLKDEAGQVRVSAVEALSHLDSNEAHRALRVAATSDELDIRRAAIVGLGMIHRLEDLPIVLEAATSPDISTRIIALSALVSFGSPSVIGALSAAAADADEQVRSTAISLLAAREEQEATEVLIHLLGAPLARERAMAALLVPNSVRISGILSSLENAGIDLATDLASILSRMQTRESRAALLSVMNLHNASARKAAASVFGVSLDASRIAALRNAAENDPDESVRKLSALLLTE